MENSRRSEQQRKKGKGTSNIVVLRWGHRPQRDARLTTHVALTARALGASGFVLSDIEDKKIEETIDKVTKQWGGPFSVRTGTSWRQVVRDWKVKEGVIVHLTAYGENIQTSDVLKRIRETGKDVMVVVGSQKVPNEFFSKDFSDFNVAIGNQPHSECSSLAVFLDRLFDGTELERDFRDAKVRIVSQKRGKKILRR
jgi:tRNA (cytidine56-2'-O)-methyltransferase